MEILIYVVGVILAVVGTIGICYQEWFKAGWYWYALFAMGLILALGVSEIVKREKMKKEKKRFFKKEV